MAALVCWGLPGCARPVREVAELNNRILELERENLQLQDQLASARARVEQLEEAVSNLRDLGDKRFDQLYAVHRVQIDRRSAVSDWDGVPGSDGVTVYLNLFDHDDQRFKSAGEARVRVYDFADSGEARLLADCHFGVEETRTLWYGRLMTYHYRLRCPWQQPPSGKRVLVRATFLDYLTGEPFQDSLELPLTPARPLN